MAEWNNEDLHELVNEAYKQTTGQEYDTLETSLLTDTGADNYPVLVEKFTKALVSQITKTFFLDTKYEGDVDVFYEDASRFGGIVRMATSTAPEVKENLAWQSFTTGQTVGTWTVQLPVIKNTYYAKSGSWALPIDISGSEWDTAISSEEEFNQWVAYILMIVENAITKHREDMNALNRNNFLAIKISHDNAVYNLLELFIREKYPTAEAGTQYKASAYLFDKEFLMFCIEKINLYISYMQRQTVLFNVDERVTFTPKNRIVVQMLSFFEERLKSVVTSEVYHNDVQTLPLHSSVACWQAINNEDFDTVSSINIKTEYENEIIEVEKGGIVGFVADKWCILHTQKSNRVTLDRQNNIDLNHYEYQYRDSYMNNLAMNAIVFLVEDYTVPATDGEE